jgi:2-keto-4-pentenoate hydratase/2-oxohepta-3-ene-1,7-dioic acid hydratase in catechol pathway
MRLISYLDATGDRLGIEHVDGRIWSASALGAGSPASMRELLDAGDAGLAALRTAAQAATAADRQGDVDATRRIAPVPRPGKVIAVGLNYSAHVQEQDTAVAAPAEPMLFAKFPTSVIGDGATVEWDPNLTSAVDLEAELAVVIGRRARHVSEADAISYVLGYTCLNDVSARDLQASDKQFVRAKSLDTFCPMGPAVVTTDELGDGSNLSIRSLVNDEVMQDSTTSDMIHDVAQLVAFCSRAFTLEPGDVIATGTPDGVGYFRDPRVVMRDGDVMTIDIEGIGRLRNPCREVGGN